MLTICSIPFVLSASKMKNGNATLENIFQFFISKFANIEYNSKEYMYHGTNIQNKLLKSICESNDDDLIGYLSYGIWNGQSEIRNLSSERLIKALDMANSSSNYFNTIQTKVIQDFFSRPENCNVQYRLLMSFLKYLIKSNLNISKGALIVMEVSISDPKKRAELQKLTQKILVL